MDTNHHHSGIELTAHVDRSTPLPAPTPLASAGVSDHDAPCHDEQHLWLPPKLLRRYQGYKVVVGLLVIIIFMGWLLIQWSNITMRLVAGSLTLVTLWVVVTSIVDDLLRQRGRQLAIEPGVLKVTKPQGTTRVPLAQIATARWRHETQDQAGLWLLDQHDGVLAHLDTAFLADQDEARTFLSWARGRVALPCKVHWPTPAVNDSYNLRDEVHDDRNR